jgi:hypothetical protein
MKKKYKNMDDFIKRDFLDKKGNAVINVDLKNKNDLFSPFSEKMLNPEILNYLDILTDPIPNKHPIIINFIMKNTKYIDMEYVRDAMRRYYWTSYENKKKGIKRQRASNIALVVLGFFSMLFGLFFKPATENPFFTFFTEFSFLISWLFLWEGISNFIGFGDKIKDMNDEKQMAEAKIRFINRRKKQIQSEKQIIQISEISVTSEENK